MMITATIFVMIASTQTYTLTSLASVTLASMASLTINIIRIIVLTITIRIIFINVTSLVLSQVIIPTLLGLTPKYAITIATKILPSHSSPANGVLYESSNASNARYGPCDVNWRGSIETLEKAREDTRGGRLRVKVRAGMRVELPVEE